MPRIGAFVVVVAALAGCTGGGSGEGVYHGLPSGELRLGVPVKWSLRLLSGQTVRTTVTDDTAALQWVRDFEGDAQFLWQPLRSGVYTFSQETRDAQGGIITTTSTLTIVARDVEPEVIATSHPLTAAYALTVPVGDEATVTYECLSCSATAKSFTTPPVVGTGKQELFLLAGMRPNASYDVHHELRNGGMLVETGPDLTYETGPIPVPEFPVVVTQPTPNPLQNALLGVSVIANPDSAFSWIFDETGTPVWYCPVPATLTRPTGQGWALLRGFDAAEVIDYTGAPSRRISLAAANLQLQALSLPPITSFHHEYRPLPDKRWTTLGSDERFITDLQGPGDVDVIGDVVLVFDDAMHVVWTWNSFDHLDITRLANPPAVCTSNAPGCPTVYLAAQANDWTHSNAIDYDPADGNLIVSSRHQSWVIKIRYENGTGDGGIVWRLGVDGDFTVNSVDPYPWFSDQHDSNYLSDGTLAVYDNGNLRRITLGSGNSRGQVYSLNETTMTAEPLLNVDLGVFSAALGSAALTPDGSYHFNSGFLFSGAGGPTGVQDDVAADGTVVASFQTPSAGVYRSFRMSDPYDTSAN